MCVCECVIVCVLLQLNQKQENYSKSMQTKFTIQIWKS